MKMAVAADSCGALADSTLAYLEHQGVTVDKLGALCGEQADYVDAARAVAERIASGSHTQGLLFCNTGTGVTMVANKVPGVRAALCPDAFTARIARLANNANVLVIGLRCTGEMLAREIVDAWLSTEPSTEARRVAFHRKIAALDEEMRGR